MKERLNDMKKDNVNQIALIHSNIQDLCPEENIYKLNDELNKLDQLYNEKARLCQFMRGKT